MKRFSLRFIQDGLDEKYQQHKVQVHKRAFERNLFIFQSFACVFNVYSFYERQWFTAAIVGFYQICIIPLIYYALLNYPKFFDQLCFAFQSAIFFALPWFVFLKLNHEPLQDLDTLITLAFGFLTKMMSQDFMLTFKNLVQIWTACVQILTMMVRVLSQHNINDIVTGQATIYIVISCNLGSRFDLKCIAILINFIGQSAVIFQKQKITPLTLVWLLTNFMILNYIYQHDRVEKEAFLIKQNEKLWQQEIASCSKIGIISCVSNEGRVQFSMERCNIISQQEFCITDQDSLKSFLKNAILIPKDKFNQQILNDMKSISKSKKYISLYNQIHKYSEKTCGINKEFMGLLGKSIQDIKIFTTSSDQLLYIHVLMTKSLKQTESEIFQKHNYERDLFAQYRQQISISIKTILIKFQKFNLSKQFQIAQGSVISDIHNALRISYNIQLFLNPSYKQTKIGFFLLHFIEQINAFTKKSMPQPYKLSIKCYIDPSMRVYSCQKTIFHIIFNLLSIIVRPAKKSGYIIISAKQTSDRCGTYVSICIASNIQTNQNLIDNQNYQKSLYGEDKGFKFNNKNIGLEIMVSEYLIGNLGPKRKIKFDNFSEDRQMISFQIYQDLNQII